MLRFVCLYFSEWLKESKRHNAARWTYVTATYGEGDQLE